MFRIVYSSCLETGVGSAEIESIVTESRERNARDQITGAWLMRGRECLAALEGPPQAVRATVERIWDDRRHTRFHLHAMGAADDRLFPSCPLQFINLTSADPATLTEHDGLAWLCSFAGGVERLMDEGLAALPGWKD